MIKNSDCSEKDLNIFLNTIRQVEGRISRDHINRLIQENGHTSKVFVEPNNLEIYHIDNMIRDRFQFRKSLILDSVKVADAVSVIGLEKNSEIQIECHACESSGEKNVSIVYDCPNANYRKNIWARLKIFQLKKVVVASSNIHPSLGDELKNDVELTFLKLNNDDQYIDSLSRINFFRVNKYIKKGSPLKYSDLISKKLVLVGKVTQVIVENQGLRLQVEAIARQSGKYGDFVNLYNPASKKHIRGQVIDFNKVRVNI